MSDPYVNPFASFFFGNGANVNLKLREKIALAQMMQKRKAPSTFGEGLSAIGESIGDIGTARRLEEQDRISQQAAMGLGTTPPVGAQGPSPVQAAAISAPSSLYQPPDQDPRSQAPVPPTVQEGGPTPTTQPMFRPNLRTATPPAQALPPAAPAVPAPPDVPGATRMSTPEQMADFRTQNPLPQNIPPMPPPGGPPPGMPPQPARPSVADYGQRPALAPTPPVVAQGGDIPPGALAGLPVAPPDDPRRAIGLALMKQQLGGQGAPLPPLAPMPPPPSVPPPDQGIAAAPPAAPIQKMPTPPEPKPAYVPPEAALPQGAPTEPPSRREMELKTLLAANQGNPYAASSPAAIELQTLEAARAKRQTYADERFKAQITQVNEQQKLRQQGLMDAPKRTSDEQRAQIEIGDLPSKLRQEAEKRLVDTQKERQQLIAPAGETPHDPRLGTPQSPQRSGIPTTPPIPAGVTPQKWAELHAPEHQKALVAVESATPDFQRMLDTIKLAREHPGKDWGTGLTSYYTPRGSDAFDFSAVVDQLKGKNFLAGYQKLKGGGAVSEVEGSKTEQSQARLDRGSSKEAFDAGLNDLEKSIRTDLEQVQRKINQPVTAWQRSNEDPPAPDKGQVVRGFSDGKTRVYLGGDPSDLKHSWRIAQ